MLPHTQNLADGSVSCWDGPSCWEQRKPQANDEGAQIGKEEKASEGSPSDGDSGEPAGAERSELIRD